MAGMWNNMNEVQYRTVLVDGKNPRGLAWSMEYYAKGVGGQRWVFIGPMPGKMVFTSCGVAEGVLSEDDAVAWARFRWKDMDPARRNRWYAPKGKYQTSTYPEFKQHPEVA